MPASAKARSGSTPSPPSRTIPKLRDLPFSLETPKPRRSQGYGEEIAALRHAHR